MAIDKVVVKRPGSGTEQALLGTILDFFGKIPEDASAFEPVSARR